eukprot:scaffold6423_cov124-Pinguiococcus_pyrenoidosus.AAC.1
MIGGDDGVNSIDIDPPPWPGIATSDNAARTAPMFAALSPLACCVSLDLLGGLYLEEMERVKCVP